MRNGSSNPRGRHATGGTSRQERSDRADATNLGPTGRDPPDETHRVLTEGNEDDMLDEVESLLQFTCLDLVSGPSSEWGTSQSTTRFSIEVKIPGFCYRKSGTWEISV